MNAAKETQSAGSWSFASSRAVQLLGMGTLVALVIGAVLGADGIPLHRPAVGTTEMVPNLLMQIVQIPIALLVIGVAFLITRRRAPIDFDARTPVNTIARRETILLLAYSTVVLFLGSRWGIGLHLHGAVFGPTREVIPTEVYAWAAYNFLLFAAVPYAVFRRRGYDHRALCLKSENLKNDILVILAVLTVESVVELSTFQGLFSLTASQLLIGMPAALVVHLLGTGIPIMIFVYAILFPRYVRLTRSPAAAVVLGALTYAWLHIFEFWTVYDSPRNAILSVAFVFLQFTFPGLIKSFLTLRTGNAWVHLWGYHAIAPHVTVDTPLIVRAFGIR